MAGKVMRDDLVLPGVRNPPLFLNLYESLLLHLKFFITRVRGCQWKAASAENIVTGNRRKINDEKIVLLEKILQLN
jgi:hypothetical protein